MWHVWRSGEVGDLGWEDFLEDLGVDMRIC